MPGPIDTILDWIAAQGFEGLGGMQDSRPVRHAQVEQYRGIKELPESKYRPSSLSKFQDQPFKSIQNYFPAFANIRGMGGKKIPNKGEIMDMSGKVLDPTAMEYDWLGPKGLYAPIEKSMGLGGVGRAKVSAGQDEKGPYISLFDSWDFEEGSGHAGEGLPYSDLERKLLKRAGQPFNIYDRIYFKPNQYGEFPRTIGAPGDIELPPDPKNKSRKR